MSSSRSAAVFLLLLLMFTVATACRKGSEEASESLVQGKTAPRSVQLYFEGANALLGAEPRTLQLPESDAAALVPVIAELLKGPVNPIRARTLPSDTVLRGAYLLPEGTAVVDLGGATLAAGWNTGSHAELMALHSVVQTVASNFQGARRVRMLVNGQPAETFAGHIRIDRALVPDMSLVQR